MCFRLQINLQASAFRRYIFRNQNDFEIINITATANAIIAAKITKPIAFFEVFLEFVACCEQGYVSAFVFGVGAAFSVGLGAVALAYKVRGSV